MIYIITFINEASIIHFIIKIKYFMSNFRKNKQKRFSFHDFAIFTSAVCGFFVRLFEDFIFGNLNLFNCSDYFW